MGKGAEADESCLTLVGNFALQRGLSLLVIVKGKNPETLEISSGGRKNSFVPEVNKLDQEGLD